MATSRLIALLIGAACCCSTFSAYGAPSASTVKLKDIARIAGAHETPLTGYGIVTGLAGTGDSTRNRATLQSIANVISRFGVRVDVQDLSSRNVAAVVVSATMPAYAESGHPLDVQVSSIGDARSLTGGVLLLTPLYGPDERLYALGKGSVIVGGFQFEAPGAQTQRNYPTAGHISGGAFVERATEDADAIAADATIDVLLNDPDFGTAQELVDAINSSLPKANAIAMSAGKIRLSPNRSDRIRLIAQLEKVTVEREFSDRVVVNERTGTIVSGAGVRLGAVSVSHGEIHVEIRTRYQVSQPNGVFVRTAPGIETVVVPESDIETKQPTANLVSVDEGATVGDLVGALRGIRLSTRDVIAILQSIKAAGALHGKLVIQ